MMQLLEIVPCWREGLAFLHLSCIVNIMASDALVTQEPKSISHNSIDLIIPEYSGFRIKKVNSTHDETEVRKWNHLMISDAPRNILQSLHVAWNRGIMTSARYSIHFLPLKTLVAIKARLVFLPYLTLYVLNFAEGTQTYIYILCHYSTLIGHRYLKSLLK